MKRGAVVCLIGLLAPPLTAEEDPFAGFDEEDFEVLESSPLLEGYFQSTFDYLPVQKKLGNARQRLWQELEQEWQDGTWKLDGAISADWNPSVGARKDADATSLRLRLFNLAYIAGAGHLTVGRQMMLWGTGTALSGGTYFNPVDPDDPFASARAVNFLASDAIRWQSYGGDSLLDLILIPEMPLVVQAEPGSLWDTADPELRSLLDEAEKQGTSAWGLKLSTTLQGMDYAAAFFSGISQTPALEVLDDRVKIRNPRYQSLFLQASMVAGEGLIRVEYTHDFDRLDDIGDGRPLSSNRDSLMLGWEGYQGEISLRAEWLGTYIHARSRTEHRGAFSGLYEWQSGDWSAELGSVMNFSDRSSMLELILTRKFTDQLQITSSGRLFSGDDDSEFGSLHTQSMLTFELTYYL